jgi:hypothetical protein
MSFQKRFAELLESGKHILNGQTVMQDPDAPQLSRARHIICSTVSVSYGCKAIKAGLATISCPTQLACCRSCMTGVSLFVSHRGRPGSVPGQSMWDLWWKKWRWERVFSPCHGFPLSVLLNQRPLHILQSCTIAAT